MKSSEIIDLLLQAQFYAEKSHGISNILQPGIIKELIMAEILGHQLIPQKDLPDAKMRAVIFMNIWLALEELIQKQIKVVVFKWIGLQKAIYQE